MNKKYIAYIVKIGKGYLYKTGNLMSPYGITFNVTKAHWFSRDVGHGIANTYGGQLIGLVPDVLDDGGDV